VTPATRDVRTATRRRSAAIFATVELPSAGASEVTTLWRYTNLFIIIIIIFLFFKPTSTKPQAETTRLDMTVIIIIIIIIISSCRPPGRS